VCKSTAAIVLDDRLAV